MVIKFQTSEKSNGNKGSSSALANYLEKEDLEHEKEAFNKGELPMPRKGFFSHKKDGLMKADVINAIDNNKKALGKNDAKFYSLLIAPSEKEQLYILNSITNKSINSITVLDKNELTKYEDALKNYTKNIMNEYAKHFNRKGLNNANQIMYYGKVEHQRKYSGLDEKVQKGINKSGELKEGLNSHIHIIVSRKDLEQKYKLSPLSKEKNNTSKLNQRFIQKGFDRNLFGIKAERVFDRQFNYSRNLNEKVEYRIQASKEPLLKASELLNESTIEKNKIQQKIIDNYNSRNGYTEQSKEISLSINNNELELKL